MVICRRIRSLIVFLLLVLCFSPGTAYAGSRKDKATIDSLWSAAIAHRNHGRMEQSNAILNDLLENYDLSKKFRKTVLYHGLAINSLLADDYRTHCHYAELSGYTGGLGFYQPLAELPPHTVDRPEFDVSVEYVADSVSLDGGNLSRHIRIPVSIGGKQEWFTLDNGCAHYSAVSESFAKEHGIHILDSKAKATGSTGAKTALQMGYADSLSVGALTFRNIIFAVLPDSAFGNLDLSTIFGANLLRLAGEMQFLQDERRIVFPRHQEDRESNLIMNQNDQHFAQVSVLGDTLRFVLDLGATNTELNASFYKRNKKWIQSTYLPNTVAHHGVGGKREINVFVAQDLTFKSCGGEFTKEWTAIETTAMEKQPDDVFGRLGVDFLLSFDKAVFNLKKMYLYVE